MSVEKKAYGKTKKGQTVHQYILRNENGLEVRCIDYGCRITHVFAPGRNGETADVVFGFDTLEAYENDTSLQGALVGRFAGRIQNASFTINSKRYQLPKNDGNNHLHGTFSDTVFAGSVTGENSVEFRYTSPDGEEGFPAEVALTVCYTLTGQNELVLDYQAKSNADTHVNLTNHTYFNLAGHQAESLQGQTLWLGSNRFLESGQDFCPTGRILGVENGAFDFRDEKPILRDIEKQDPQIKQANGYDHSFVIEKQRAEAFSMAAIARHPASGRILRVFTSQPSVHLYTANGMNGSLAGKAGSLLKQHGTFCLETQHYPDSPNQPDFPTTLLQAGEKFHEVTVYQFQRESSE